MASQFTHQVGVLYKSDAGTIASTQETFVGNAEENINIDVPANNVGDPLALPLGVTVANIVSFTLYSKLPVVVKTYDGVTEKDTINLAGAKQILWDTNSTATNPLAHDFTSLKVTNAHATLTSQFRASILLTS